MNLVAEHYKLAPLQLNFRSAPFSQLPGRGGFAKITEPLRKKHIFFSPTRPHWAELVIEFPCPCVCLCVCLRHRETPTSGGRVDLWSKIAFLILVWDDTIFKKGGVKFFSEIGKTGGFGTPPPYPKHPLPVVVYTSGRRLRS